jgi:hypothetical protein
MCGCPIFDYEHIYGYDTTGHDVDKMTLLCPKHHREKTAGRLSIQRVLQSNARPFNTNRAVGATHQLDADALNFEIALGSLVLRSGVLDGQRTGLMVDGAHVIGATIERGHLNLSLDIRDAQNRPILRVTNGELRTSTTIWDVTFEGNRLEVRGGKRKILIALLIDPQKRLTVESASFHNQFVKLLIGHQAPNGGVYLPNDETGLSNASLDGFYKVGRIGNYPEDEIFGSFEPRREYGSPPVERSSGFYRPRS